MITIYTLYYQKTHSQPWTGGLDTEKIILTDITSLYEYYNKFSKNVNIKIIDKDTFQDNIDVFIKEISKMHNGNKLPKWSRECTLKMIYLRFLVLNYAKKSNRNYSHYLYFRDDNHFTFPLFIDYLHLICRNNSMLTDKYHKFGGVCDKIFFGKCKLFDTIFGNDFVIFLQEWIKIGRETNFRTEYFYKELMRRAKIKNKCVNFS